MNGVVFMSEKTQAKKYLNFKEIAAYSLGLFGFQAIVGLLNSYQAEFDASILGADIAVVGILILVAKIISAVADPVVGGLVLPELFSLKFRSRVLRFMLGFSLHILSGA